MPASLGSRTGSPAPGSAMAASVPSRDRRLTAPVDLVLASRLAIIGALVGLAAIAWWATDLRMAGMDAGPGTDPGTLGFYVTAWVVMMAAMMFPSIAPMVVMFARIQEGKRERGDAVPAGATALFVAGYLITWTMGGLLAYGILETGRSLDIEALSWDR